MEEKYGLVKRQGKASDYCFLYRSGSLLVCIFVHGMVDAFSKFAVYEQDMTTAYIYMSATIVVAVVYCVYLNRKPTALEKE